MLTIVLLKALSDLGIYYTLAGTVAAAFGARAWLMLASMAVEAGALGAGYVMRERGRMRFLPLAVMPLCWLLPGSDIWSAAIAVPPMCYAAYVTAKGAYVPDWSRQTDIFSAFWKVALAIAAVTALCGGMEILFSISVPAAMTAAVCSVLLTRSLRHEPQIYCQARYQAVNIGIVALCLLAACVMGTRMFVDGMLTGLKMVYGNLVMPILLAIIYGAMYVVQGIAWLFSFIKLGFRRPEEQVQVDIEGAQEILDIQETVEGGEWLITLLIIIAVAAALGIAFLLFRYLAKGQSNLKKTDVTGETRYSLDPPAERRGRERNGQVGKIRAQYRQIMKLCRERGMELRAGSTSADVEHFSGGIPDADSALRLREIYIGARYDGHVDEEAVKTAKEICRRAKRS